MSNGIANEALDQKVIYEPRCEDFRSLNVVCRNAHF